MHKYCTLVATQIRWPKEKCKRKFVDFHFQKNCSLRLESWSAPNTELELRWGIDRHKQDSLTDTIEWLTDTSKEIDRHQPNSLTNTIYNLTDNERFTGAKRFTDTNRETDRQLMVLVSVCISVGVCQSLCNERHQHHWRTDGPITEPTDTQPHISTIDINVWFVIFSY